MLQEKLDVTDNDNDEPVAHIVYPAVDINLALCGKRLTPFSPEKTSSMELVDCVVCVAIDMERLRDAYGI